MSFYFGEKTWVELLEYIKKDALIILPVGTVEEHGRHLPVNTDARIADEVAKAIAEDIESDVPVLVMPAVWSGYSPVKMQNWPGTISVGIDIFTGMVHDICASLVRMGFTKIIMLDCHGQHAPMLNIVTKKIADEFDTYIAVTSPLVFSAAEFDKVRKSGRGGVLHGCEWETSVMLGFTDLVKMEEATSEDMMRYHSKFVSGDSAKSGQKVVWSTWGLQDSKTGVYGDPTAATADMGRFIMDAAVKNYREFILEYYNFKK